MLAIEAQPQRQREITLYRYGEILTLNDDFRHRDTKAARGVDVQLLLHCHSIALNTRPPGMR